MTIKAISLYQPWASLVIAGYKRYETRHWSTNYRGPLLIHAARKWTDEQQQAAATFEMQLGHNLELPRGALLGCVEMIGVFSCEQVFQIDDTLAQDQREQSMGDFRPHRFAWRLTNPLQFKPHIPLIGRQGLFSVTIDNFDSIAKALSA